MGVIKSADVCSVGFAVGRMGVGSIFLFFPLITAGAVWSIVGGRLTKVASLLSASLRFAGTLGYLEWICDIKRV